MTKAIPLEGPASEGGFLVVDDEDYELMSQFKWRAKFDGRNVYAVTTVAAHNMVMTGPLIDHINGDGLDNTRDNLRVATSSQNSMNRRIRNDSKTGYKGVTRMSGRNAYRARIQIGDKRKYIGYFKNAEDAALAYDRAAREHYGEFARVNFPGLVAA